jgi:Na+/H+-dicarboxylate symporter
MEAKSDHRFTIKILIGMALGVLVGVSYHLIAHYFPAFSSGFLASLFKPEGWLYHLGQMFMRLIKMLVLPVVFVSLVCGGRELKSMSDMGRLGFKTLGLYLLTTALAVTMALCVATLFNVGQHAGSPVVNQSSLEQQFQQDEKKVVTASLQPPVTSLPVASKKTPSVAATISGFIPDNVFKSLYNSNMLQVVIFALFFGMVLSFCGKSGETVGDFFQSLNDVLIQCMKAIISLAPIGVFFLLAYNFGQISVDGLWSLLKYVIVLIAVLLLQLFVVYSGFIALLARLNPKTFLKKMCSPMLFAFSVSSSSASIPVVLSSVRKKLGVHNRVASFVIPVGATVNMDGTAIMQGVATVFIANWLGFHLTMMNYLTVILMATLASVGTAGVPSAGIFTLMLVLQKVIPSHYNFDAAIVMLFAVDRILDMLRTAVNVAGDAMVACVVARSEKMLSMETYQDGN